MSGFPLAAPTTLPGSDFIVSASLPPSPVIYSRTTSGDSSCQAAPWLVEMETGTVPKSWVNNVSPKSLGSWSSLLNPLASQPHPQSHWWPWVPVGGLADQNAFSPIIPSNPVKQAGQAYFHLYSSVTRLQGWFPARRKPRSPDCPHLPHIRCLLAQVALVLFYFCRFLAIQCLLSSSNT